jgi:hypothetical protein
MLCFSFYVKCFFFNKSENKRAEQVLPGGEVGEGRSGQNNVYIGK